MTGGKILIDGQDVRGVTLHSLRGAIGVVQQDVYLFSGTVAENIAYGRPGATRAEIEEAARLAGADAFVRALKDGYDTYAVSAASSCPAGRSSVWRLPASF